MRLHYPETRSLSVYHGAHYFYRRCVNHGVPHIEFVQLCTTKESVSITSSVCFMLHFTCNRGWQSTRNAFGYWTVVTVCKDAAHATRTHVLGSFVGLTGTRAQMSFVIAVNRAVRDSARSLSCVLV